MNVHGLIECVRLYDQVDAAQGSEQGSGLRAAAQSLSDAFLDLMHAAVPSSPNVNDTGDKVSQCVRFADCRLAYAVCFVIFNAFA